jgi:hypothetical protein
MTPHAQILADAAALIDGQRQEDYGPPAVNFQRIAAFWAAYLGVKVTAADVCRMMELLKISRLRNQPDHEDSAKDAASYAALGHEMAILVELDL